MLHTKNNKTVLTFVLVVSSFAFANLWTYYKVSEITDSVNTVGFPVTFYWGPGFPGKSLFMPTYLIADICIAVAVAVLIAAGVRWLSWSHGAD